MLLVNIGSEVKYTFAPFSVPNANPDALKFAVAPFAEFLESVRSRSSLSIMLYTGRTLDQLRRQAEPLVERCLASIDILVDGPYVEDLNDGAGWRGSSNQVIHALGNRAVGAECGATAPRRVELIVNASGMASFTGIPGRGRGLSIAGRLERCSAGPQQEGNP